MALDFSWEVLGCDKPILREMDSCLAATTAVGGLDTHDQAVGTDHTSTH